MHKLFIKYNFIIPNFIKAVAYVMALLNIRKSLDLIRLRQCVVGSADIVLYISKCVVIMLRFGENNLQFVVTEACRLTLLHLQEG